jgi:hypothetical protein
MSSSQDEPIHPVQISFTPPPSVLIGLLPFPDPLGKLPERLRVPGEGKPGRGCDWEERNGSATEDDKEALLLSPLLLSLREFDEEGPKREATRESISRRDEGVPGGG